MKTSIVIATFLVVSAGAAGAGALAEPNPYQGSDTLFNVTRQSLSAVSLSPTDYVGGGSGNGQAAMALATPTQTTSPMSRMMNNGGGLCAFAGGTNGSTATNASSLVVALDAVDILASSTTGSSAACSGGAPGGLGILNSGGAISATTWKDALALIYGGKDNQTGKVDCNQTSRVNLVSNWSNLFQNACANGSTTCSDSNHATGTGITAGTAPLWHAWRRDETSGTSDVFSSILGLSPSTSSSALNGFGTSPFCNALNWDTTNNTAGGCLAKSTGTFNPHGQFIGPGGVLDPADTTGVHRMPPPGLNGLAVYGGVPAVFTFKGSKVAFDVLPTDMQDNDPIRRACYGGTVKVLGHIGEDVCNIDGSLGLVVSLVDTDFVQTIADPVNSGQFLKQYPPVAQKCTGSFINSVPPNVFSCAPGDNFHPGECPNGDAPNGGQCVSPIAAGFGQCNASNSTVSANFIRPAAANADGRAFNLFLTSGSLTDGGVTFVQQNIPALGTSIDFAGAFNRVHQIDVAVAGATACQMTDMTDQIGCLGQADPCSIGYAGDGGKGWNTHAAAPNGGVGTLPSSPGSDAVNVFAVYPQTSTVQLLGKAGEYPLSRKLYFASLAGFNTVTSDELTLAKFEAGSTSAFESIITTNDFFELGAQSGAVAGGAANTTFCEDFDEQVVCNPNAATASTLAANVNGCATNPSGIPTASTICGNGTRESYEECDDGTGNGTTGDKCSQTCRCTTFLDPTTGNCH
jgi:cysteine-rich repeat protein